MRTAWWLSVSMLLLIFPRMGYADAAAERKLQAELRTTVKQIEKVNDQVDRLESLLASLSENKAQFAGYGVFRHEGDLNRVREQLYKARALQGELTARKLYLNHLLDTKTSWQKRTQAGTPDSLVPTPNPEACESGALNVDGKWFCMKPVPAAPAAPLPDDKPQAAAPPPCPLGTVEENGTIYCLGEEPGALAPWDNTLGNLLLDEKGEVVETAPAPDMSLVQKLRLK